ncbi:MAG: NAD-dependent epimerase/dehydratase family protein [Armatimonadota bacterium]
MTKPWTDTNVLVTGAAGFLGSHLAARLVSEGAHVVALLLDDPAESNFDILGLRSRTTCVWADVADRAALERILAVYEIDCVFHLAAQAIVGVANRAPLSAFESNVRGTYVLLEACRHAPSVSRVVVASSDKAYGCQERLPYTEDSPLLAQYPYDASKACADILARCYHATYGLPVAVTRCANLYGGGDLNFSRIVPDTMRSVVAGKPPVIRSDGTPERDYLYIDDAVAAYVALARALPREDVAGRAFNFGSGEPVSVLRLVEAIISVSGHPELQPQILGTSKHGEIDRQWLDSSEAERVLGWRADTPLSEGLATTFEWYARFFHTRTNAH